MFLRKSDFMLQWLKGGKSEELDRKSRLEAIPIKNPQVQRTVLSQGRVMLRGSTQPKGMRRLLGATPTLKQFEIDTWGDWVWMGCDGRQTVEELVRRFSTEYRLNLREAESSVVGFLNLLAKRRLVAFVIGKQAVQTTRKPRRRSA